MGVWIRHILRLVSLLFVAVTAIGNAGAQDGALVGLHDLRIEKGRLCMSDHFHSGSSNAMPNKRAAQRDAVASWAGFTALEYGDAWGDYRLAASKKMGCTNAGRAWTCVTEARPCRRLTRAERRRPRSKRRGRKKRK